MVGPDCILVKRSAQGGYRVRPVNEAAVLQQFLLNKHDDPGWLFEQCHRIADALSEGDLPLAQIFGLRIPLIGLDGRRLKQLDQMSV
jgi:hypothetical protein